MLVIGLSLSILVGVTLGMLGGGGSILTVPLLHYVLGMDGHTAIAASLLVVATTSLAALIPHVIGGRVVWRIGLSFAAAAMVGAYFAGRIAHYIPAPILLLSFAVMMLATSYAMLRPRRSVPKPPPRPRPLLAAGEGLVVGAATGLVGAGGGFLVVPALVLLGGLGMAEAIATSLLVIALKSLSAAAGYWGTVTIDWPLVAAVVAFAILGSVIGARLVSRIAADTLRRAFGWLVVVMAAVILGQELGAVVPEPWLLPTRLAVATALLAVVVVSIIRAYRRRSHYTTL